MNLKESMEKGSTGEGRDGTPQRRGTGRFSSFHQGQLAEINEGIESLKKLLLDKLKVETETRTKSITKINSKLSDLLKLKADKNAVIDGQ